VKRYLYDQAKGCLAVLNTLIPSLDQPMGEALARIAPGRKPPLNPGYIRTCGFVNEVFLRASTPNLLDRA
jgi:hypothetical protein